MTVQQNYPYISSSEVKSVKCSHHVRNVNVWFLACVLYHFLFVNIIISKVIIKMTI